MNEPGWLLVNIGSRSCKLSLHDPAGGRRAEWTLEENGDPETWLAEVTAPVAMTVHRLVHGGRVLTAPAWWSAALDEALTPLDTLAPLHNPQARRWARACAERWPQARHCLLPDTGFFQTLPAVSRTLPLPAVLRAQHGLQRYGFHGLAHSALWQGLHRVDPRAARGRVITLQLGGGCSAAALQGGQPVDTSMGFTPLAGLVMATRPGDLDPGVLLHLLRAGMTVAELEHMLAHESGLKGLSGRSGDMHELLADATAEAVLAIDQFCHRARQYVGAYAATLGGLDALVFGGGIGEHAAAIRQQICAGLEFLGVTVDDAANTSARAPACLSRAGSHVAVWVMPGDEEAEMHRLAQQFLENT